MVGGINFHQISALEDGGWEVTWQSGYPSIENANIYQQAFEAGGNPRGSRSRVNDFTSGLQLKAQFTATSDRWVVVWQSAGQDGSGNGIYMKIFPLN